MKSILILILSLTIKLAFGQTAVDYFNTAEKFKKKDNVDSAFLYISKAISIDSTNRSYYGFRGRLLHSVGAYNNAIIDFESEYYFTPDSIKIYPLINISASKIRMRDFIGAYNDLIFALNMDSSNAIVLSNLSTICDEIGKGDETLKYLFKALSIDSSDYVIINNIGFKYQSLGQYEKAIEYFLKVQDLKPNEPASLCNIGFNIFKLGNLKEAKNYLNKSLEFYPENSYALKVRALIFIEERNFSAACVDLHNAIEWGYKINYGDDIDELIKKYCK